MPLTNHSFTPVSNPPPVNTSPLPPVGSGVIVSDDDLLESLHRDGYTIGTPPHVKASAVQLAMLFVVVLTLSLFVIGAFIIVVLR